MGLSRCKDKRCKTPQFLSDIVAQWRSLNGQNAGCSGRRLGEPVQTCRQKRVPIVCAGARYIASGVGFSAGGSMPKELAVMQVIEKLPIAATSATSVSRPMVFSAAA